jgi:hypothetical protein
MAARSRLLVVVLCALLAGSASLTVILAQVPGIRGLGGANRSGNRDQRRQQQDQQAQQQFQSLPVLQMIGTVDAVMPGYIKVVNEAKQTWIIQVLPNARCQMTGKGTPEALAPGMFVRFIGEVNKRGAVEQKVGKLTVFTPSQVRQVGAEPDSGLGTSFGPRPGDEVQKDEKPRPVFGAGAAAPDAGRAAGARKAGGQAGGGGKAAGPQVYDIRGHIVGSNNGRINLQVPNAYFRPSLRIEVAEDAEIDVELDDAMAYTLARKGDKVRIQGRQGLNNRGFAEEVDISLSEPLGASQADGKKQAKGAKSKRGAEPDEPADGKSADDKADKKGKDAEPAVGKGKKDEAAGTKKPAESDEPDAADGAPKKRSKAADADAPEKPAKKKKKASKADAANEA